MLGLLFAVAVMEFMLEIKGVLLGEAIMTASRFLLWWYIFFISVKMVSFVREYNYLARLVIDKYEKYGHKKKMTWGGSAFIIILPTLLVCGAFLINKSVYPNLSTIGGYVYKYERLVAGIIFLITGVLIQISLIGANKEKGSFKIEDVDS